MKETFVQNHSTFNIRLLSVCGFMNSIYAKVHCLEMTPPPGFRYAEAQEPPTFTNPGKRHEPKRSADYMNVFTEGSEFSSY